MEVLNNAINSSTINGGSYNYGSCGVLMYDNGSMSQKDPPSKMGPVYSQNPVQ